MVREVRRMEGRKVCGVAVYFAVFEIGVDFVGVGCGNVVCCSPDGVAVGFEGGVLEMMQI